MLNGKYDETWSTCDQIRRETPWNWQDGLVESERVRDRVRRWWQTRGSRLEHLGPRERGKLEEDLQCVECGDRFFAPPGTVRCVSCSDQEW